MKAIIRFGNGKCYASKVFAIQNNKIHDKREAAYNWHYIVFDEKNEKLISKKYLFQFNINDFIHVNNKKDIENLLVVSGGFHDAYIDKIEKINDESIKVLFDGVWGCKIEIIFEGDVSYNDSFKAPYEVSQEWYNCSLNIINNYFVLVSDEEYNINELNDSFPWFKAKKMKYRILPD